MCEHLVGASRPSVSTWSQSILPLPGTLECPDPQPQACLTVQGLLAIVDLPSGLWWYHRRLQYLLLGLLPDQFVTHHALEFRLRKLRPLSVFSFLFSIVFTILFLLYVCTQAREGGGRRDKGGKGKEEETEGEGGRNREGESRRERDIFL